jgi:hypothetical protein
MVIPFRGGKAMTYEIIPRNVLDARRARYKPGTRVELIRMDDPYTTLKPGDRGEVIEVDSIGTVHVDWDYGSILGAAYGVDVLMPVSEPPSEMSRRRNRP